MKLPLTITNKLVSDLHPVLRTESIFLKMYIFLYILRSDLFPCGETTGLVQRGIIQSC